ncbi:DUF2199 domain-containing protein [Paludibaculum fermentans]|uniref:DUF2199 domain-containing protein n=2 Tax=Paludibaculum fermentans TaxID=1473598 RepID=A0A7S7SNX8_PALFE|nr:DUF2199 domain-containing protein [Paludibaculum fermentans]
MSFAADSPDMYANMSESDRETRAVIGSDQCIIDGKWFFLRGCLEIPLIGSREVFLWGLWAILHETDFDEISESWEEVGRQQLHGPFKGRLANSLSACYEDCLNLKLRIVLRPVGERPLFVLEETEHPLSLAQATGISEQAAVELAVKLLHCPY